MSDLVVLGFDTEAEVNSLIDRLQQMQKERIIELLDVVKVTRDAEGKTKIKQGVNLAAAGAFSGAFWGMLIGMIFWMPWLGMAIGAASGALGGKLQDYGIDDDFIKQTAETIQPGQAGLFLLIGSMTADKVAQELEGTAARVIKTSMSNEQEAQLRELFSHE